MKKVKLVLGFISSIVGFAMLLCARMEIATNSRYTWRTPYSQYEAGVMVVQWIGILLLVCGIIDIVVAIVAQRYVSNNVKDIDTHTVIKCPECGIRVDSNAKICPKCNKALKEN